MGLSSVDRSLYRFGAYELDVDQLKLSRDGQRVSIQSKPLALLVCLVRSSDRVVPRDELLRVVWPGPRSASTDPGDLGGPMPRPTLLLVHGAWHGSWSGSR